jgi:hypothetical protein
LAAADGAPDADALEARRRAALQFLISGHIDEGLEVLRAVLDAIGMRWPATPRRALWSLLLRRAQLRLRGLGFQRRDPRHIAAADLARVDICLSAADGLTMADHIRGSDFRTRSLLLALRVGEPSRVARALAWEAGHVSGHGTPSRRRTERLLEAAEALAVGMGHSSALATVALVKGIASFCLGRWAAAREFFARAETIFRDRCTGVTWEIDTAHHFWLWTLFHLGELTELARRRSALLEEAHERGDLYAATNLSTHLMAVVRLAADDPAGAREELDGAMRRWSFQGFHVQHYGALIARGHILMYQANARAAWDHVKSRWPALERSLLLNVQKVRVDALHLRAMSALAAAGAEGNPAPLLRSADGDAQRLEREAVAWASAIATQVRSGIAAARGDRESAARNLRDAAARFDALAMRLNASAARRRLGILIGDRGRNLVAEADAWMASEQIRNPSRMTAMLAPGFPD